MEKIKRDLLWQVREYKADFQARAEENGDKVIEGYFAVFNSNYDIGWGMSESIAPGAFTNTLADDIRALVNHNTDLVLGRTTVRTLELRQDERGLWGRIVVNPEDTDAMNLYSRVKRGDVSQCSIGFNVLREETEFLEDGGVHWTLREIDLHEVSVCTFPAYEGTEVTARKRDYDEIMKKKRQAWRDTMTARLRGEKHGTESDDEGKGPEG